MAGQLFVQCEKRRCYQKSLIFGKQKNMTDEKLLELQELFTQRLSELFPYKTGGRHRDFSRMTELDLSDTDRKHAIMTVHFAFKSLRICPERCLLLIQPLFTPDEFKLFQEAQIYQSEKAKLAKQERAKTIHSHRKTIGRSPKPFSGGLEQGSIISTADGDQVKVIKQLDSGNYIVSVVATNERRLLGRDDMRLVPPKYS